jgi:hypothetical protein
MLSRLRFRILTSFLFGVLLSIQSSAQTQKDPWTPLQFLIGSWLGTGLGKPGEAVQGTATFSFDLNKSVIVRKTKVEIASKPGETTSQVHEDLMIIHPQPGDPKFGAEFFDNEGHVIRYTIDTPKPGVAIFESKAAEKAPRFQLVYASTDEDKLTTDFLIAPPGGDFTSYIKGTAQRIK